MTVEDKIVDFCKKPKSRQEIADFVGVKTANYVYTKYIEKLLQDGKLALTIPDTPRSKYQKYYRI